MFRTITLLLAIAFLHDPATTQSAQRFVPDKHYHETFPRQRLTEAGGDFHNDPCEPTRQVCVISQNSKDRAISGLLVSTDGGARWRFLSRQLWFCTVFIHPQTGDLFAAIESPQTIVDPRTRKIALGFSYKAVWSKDGITWIDITPDGGGFMGPPSFRKSDVRPRAIVITGCGLSIVDYTSLDDEYRNWRQDGAILLPCD